MYSLPDVFSLLYIMVTVAQYSQWFVETVILCSVSKSFLTFPGLADLTVNLLVI